MSHKFHDLAQEPATGPHQSQNNVVHPVSAHVLFSSRVLVCLPSSLFHLGFPFWVKDIQFKIREDSFRSEVVTLTHFLKHNNERNAQKSSKNEQIQISKHDN